MSRVAVERPHAVTRARRAVAWIRRLWFSLGAVGAGGIALVAALLLDSSARDALIAPIILIAAGVAKAIEDIGQLRAAQRWTVDVVYGLGIVVIGVVFSYRFVVLLGLAIALVSAVLAARCWREGVA